MSPPLQPLFALEQSTNCCSLPSSLTVPLVSAEIWASALRLHKTEHWQCLELFESHICELVHTLKVGLLTGLVPGVVSGHLLDSFVVDGLALGHLITIVGLAKSGCICGECWEGPH